jgi:hypothetical protein
MIGLLTMFVLIPAVKVFSAPGFVWQFPYAPSSVGGLTFVLHVANPWSTPSHGRILTTPNGGTPISHAITINPLAIVSFTPADVSCPTGVVCQVVVVYDDAASVGFNPILEMQTAAGVPLTFVTSPYNYPTQ